MNSIRQIQELNKRELENGVSPEASWHADYRDTAYIYIGGLPFELSEGDVMTIFSQFGEPTYINLVRDKETGKSRGFAFLKYEDQRSTDLAVDNLGGSVIMGRTLKVDHTRYKKKDDDPEEMDSVKETSKQIENDDGETRRKRRRTSETDEERPMIQEERELAKLIREHDEEDPMKAFLIQEKKEEVSMALARLEESKQASKSRKHGHRHHRSHPKEGKEELEYSRHSRHRRKDRDSPSAPEGAMDKEDRLRDPRRPSPTHERSMSGDRRERRRSQARDSRERFRDTRDRDSDRRRRADSPDDRYRLSRRDS